MKKQWPLIQSICEEDTTKDDKLSPLEMDEIQKHIRRGAKDIDQKWASAIELTKKAYETTGQPLPLSPATPDSWECLLTNIEHAVKMLSKYRGIEDQAWRITDVPNKI